MENCNAPVELVDGFVGRIEVHVPWTALTVENTHLQVKNLELTLQPKQRDDSLGWYFLVGNLVPLRWNFLILELNFALLGELLETCNDMCWIDCFHFRHDV